MEDCWLPQPLNSNPVESKRRFLLIASALSFYSSVWSLLISIPVMASQRPAEQKLKWHRRWGGRLNVSTDTRMRLKASPAEPLSSPSVPPRWRRSYSLTGSFNKCPCRRLQGRKGNQFIEQRMLDLAIIEQNISSVTLLLYIC